MKHRQIRPRVPRQWMIADDRMGDRLWHAVRRLPPGSGILVIYRDLSTKRRAKLLSRLRTAARARNLIIVDENAREAIRVHDISELRRALQQRIPMILLSPLNRTRSHPEWQPIKRMRAAALARLGKRRLFALGGMDETKFRRIERLGFQGWAGIEAFRT
jgi:thiamine-phosphate pyrophosphorylase